MNILLGVTGSVAAIKTPLLENALRDQGHEVQIVATKAATYFFDFAPLRHRVTLDEDEWPGRDMGQLYQRGDRVAHVELRNWADLFLVAPLDANTLAKLATGLCDNCLTCVWRAWPREKAVILAPAMNTLMWEHPFTREHLDAVKKAFGPKMIEISPIVKTLACGDVGTGAMAEVEEIVRQVELFRTKGS